jgi:hypothetical protein
LQFCERQPVTQVLSVFPSQSWRRALSVGFYEIIHAVLQVNISRKRHDELVLIWETHANPEVATWDNGQGYEAGGPLLTAPATKLLAKNSA